MSHKSWLLNLLTCGFVTIIIAGCISAGVSVPIGDASQVDLRSNFSPLARNCSDLGNSLRQFTPPADLYWLARCDAVKVRWSRYSIDSPQITNGPLDMCNLPSGNSIAVLPDIQLHEFPAAMSGAGTVVATYDGFVGCEPRNARVPPGFPDDFEPTMDARLELRVDLTVEASGPPPITIAVTDSTPRVMTPRVLTALGCEAFVDPDAVPAICTKREFRWQVKSRGIDGVTAREDFSPLLRVTSIRILRGQLTTRGLPGIEGAVPAPGNPALAEVGFDCTKDMEGNCMAVRPEYVEVAGRAGRCHFDPSNPNPGPIDIVSECRNAAGQTIAAVSANPTEFFPFTPANNKRPVWTIQFDSSTGFPIPDDPGEVLAIEFTLVSL